MRILINSINYFPELTGIGKYSGEMAEFLSKNGHEVRVITAPPYYPEWTVGDQYSSISYRIENINGVKVYRCPLYVPLKPSGLKRIIHLASFALSSLPVLLKNIFWKPDIIITIEPPLFSSIGVLLTGFFSASKTWLHVQDFEVDAAYELGILSSGRVSKNVFNIERWIMNKFDVVSTISEQMLKKLDGKGVIKSKQILFPNWVDIDYIYPLKSESCYRKKLDIKNNQVVALYSGNMGEKQGLEIIIDSAIELSAHDNIVFVMCGSGAVLPKIKKQAEGLKNVIWIPLQPFDKLNELLNLADIHLLPQKAGVADLVLPSKLTGMFASGRPVLTVANKGTQLANVVENRGFAIASHDVNNFSKTLLELTKNRALCKKYGANARSYAEDNLGSDAILRRFVNDLSSLI